MGTHEEAQAHAVNPEPVATMSAGLPPPPPRIRLRIGVSGHRVPPKLPTQSEPPLRALLDRILATIVDTAHDVESDYPADRSANLASKFVIVSSVAEGSDRIVAEAGLAAGFELQIVLPFARAEYARDFATPESRAAFERLLADAATVFELDGAAGERPRAYEAAGFVMLANVDLLIAIWDGEEATGVGGTAQIVSRAVADGIPIIRIDPQNPSAMQISWSRAGDLPPANAHAQPKRTFRSADQATIALVTKEILALPAPDKARQSLAQYLIEKERRWNFCPWYPLLLLAFAGRWPRLADFRLPSPLAETRAQWESYFTVLPEDRAQRPAIERILLSAFSVADHLAVYYSLVYRSTYVFNFLFAAVAVALALAGIFIHDTTAKAYFVAAELMIIVTILVTWYYGNRLQWHRRWLEYRRLAECLRHMRILAPLGSEGSIDRPGRNRDIDGQDWVNWYAWSLRRLIPLPDRAVGTDYLAAIRDAVRSAEIAGQAQYHTNNAHRVAKLETRIHHTGQMLFAITGLMCAVFIALYMLDVLPDSQNPYRDLTLAAFTFLTALFPTIGSALGAIYVQGDFKTVAGQSRRTAKRLAIVDKILADEPLDFARLADRIQKTSDIMMADLEEWQTVFRTRPLSLPA
jgi:hypothetical protein